jgi:hypothetical protein
LKEEQLLEFLQMLYSFDMFDFIVTQIQRYKVLEILQVLNAVDEIIVQIQFDQGSRETTIDTAELIIP